MPYALYLNYNDKHKGDTPYLLSLFLNLSKQVCHMFRSQLLLFFWLFPGRIYCHLILSLHPPLSPQLSACPH